MLAFVVNNSGAGNITTAAAGWVRLSQIGGGQQLEAIFAKVAAAGDPATVTFTLPASGCGVVCDYGNLSVPSSSATVNGSTTTQQAPAVPTWQASMVVVEFWGTSANTTLAITTNVNSPTTRAAFASGNGSLLVADFRQTMVTTATTGDTAGNAPVVFQVATSLAVGA